MSLIENALKKLQGVRPTPTPVSPSGAVLARPRSGRAIPVARKKKVVIEGPKHPVSQLGLVGAGLLVPVDKAVLVADEFRRIKRPLISNAFNGESQLEAYANVIMITSPLPRAGKTFCSVNLAVSMSLERDLNVLLVDADVAKPHITREFGLVDRPGLIDLLVDDRDDLGALLVRTDLNDIQVLPSGRPHPQATELLASERMSRILRELATRYADRIVLLDSPPLLITSEAQALASQVGQITLIVEAGQTTEQELTQTIEVLNSEKAVNVVLNKSPNWSWSRSGDYSGEYGYGYERTT